MSEGGRQREDEERTYSEDETEGEARGESRSELGGAREKTQRERSSTHGGLMVARPHETSGWSSRNFQAARSARTFEAGGHT